MKKIIGFFVVLALLSFTYISIDGLLFKVEFKPSMKYSQSTYKITETTIKYSGSDEFLQKLKDEGVENPTVSKKDLKMVSVIKTSKLTDATHFPLTMQFDSCVSSDGKEIIPPGTIIYGQSTTSSMPTLDSIYAPGKDDEFKQAFLKSMGSIFSQIPFPDRKLNVGDTFSLATPITIPIGGINISMNISTTYKLTDMAHGIAYFDILQSFTMTMSSYSADGGGIGSGKLEYDIAHNYYSYMQQSTTVNLKMKTDDFGLDLNLKQSVIERIAFSPN